MPIDLQADFHMHSTYSDGGASIMEMAESALQKGFHLIAITDHVPLPYATRYAMDIDHLDAYRADLETVRKDYAGRLAVQTGLEVEYIPRFRDWLGDIASMEWDVTLASVHTLFKNDVPCLVNGNETEFNKCLIDHFRGDIKELTRAYYDTLLEAIETSWFSIVAHLDVFKKFNAGNRLFDEADPWYQDLVSSVLDTIKGCGMKMEINMGGLLHPIGRPYPSPWIIRAAAERKIPLVMGSDSHRPDTIGQGFDRIPAVLGGISMAAIY